MGIVFLQATYPVEIGQLTSGIFAFVAWFAMDEIKNSELDAR